MKYAPALLVLPLVAGLATSGFCHPPSEVTARFETDDLLLTVTVMHGVRDAAKHYIEEIEVELNGKKMIEQKFRSQGDGKVQEAIYRLIDAKVGNEIKITAGCNISGRKNVVIRVEEKQVEGEAETRDAGE